MAREEKDPLSPQDYLRILVKSGSNIPIVAFRALYYKLRGKRIRAHQKVSIKGLSNITTNDHLDIGLQYVGFMLPSDRTFLNVQGKMVIKDYFNLGRGCRIDVGKNGTLILHGGRITANTTIIAMHHVEIGRDCSISWGVEFLDSDFHELNYEGRVERDPSIIIGDRAWIGCHVKILKGTRIGNGCVIAANSVLNKPIEGDNLLIGGNPARVLRENITWR